MSQIPHRPRIPTSKISELAASWLADTAGPNRACWIWTTSVDAGLDLALDIYRDDTLGSRDHQRFDIPEDTLPVRLENPESGNQVFIVSQPNHLDPVVTSMNEFSLGDVKMETAANDVARAQHPSMQDEKDDFLRVSINSNGDEVTVRKPEVILVDHPTPVWQSLYPYIGGSTNIIQSDKVSKEKSLEAEMQRISNDIQKAL